MVIIIDRIAVFVGILRWQIVRYHKSSSCVASICGSISCRTG